MNLRNEVELLSRVPIFAEVEPSQLQVIAFSADRLRVRTGQYLIRQGQSDSCGYLVLDGKADALREVDGVTDTVAQLGPGALVGRMAMICGLPHSLSVRATTPLHAARISNELFTRLCAEFPETGKQVMSALLKSLNGSMEDLNTVQRMFEPNAGGFGRFRSRS